MAMRPLRSCRARRPLPFCRPALSIVEGAGMSSAASPPFAPKGQKIAAQGTTLGNRAWKRQALKGRYRPRRFHPVHFTFCRRPSLPVPGPLTLLVQPDQPPKIGIIAQPC